MKEALQFLKSHNEVALATIGCDNKPKIRIFQIMKQEGTTLYFATAPHKEVYKQLQQNPYIEILAHAQNISVRIEGKAQFEVSDEMAQEIFNTNPVLPRLYPNYQALVYFSLTIDQMDYFDLIPTPPIFKHYDSQLS